MRLVFKNSTHSDCLSLVTESKSTELRNVFELFERKRKTNSHSSAKFSERTNEFRSFLSDNLTSLLVLLFREDQILNDNIISVGVHMHNASVTL